MNSPYDDTVETYQHLVGQTFLKSCTDQTGRDGTYEVTIDRITLCGTVAMAHFDRPRGNTNKPTITGKRVNAYAMCCTMWTPVERTT